MWNPTLLTSGSPAVRTGPLLPLLALAMVGLSGCLYTFQAGAGLPSHIQTMAVLSFENETSRFELTQEVHQILQAELPQQFGVRTASEEYADAIVRGTIRGYDVAAPSYRASPDGRGAQVLERQVSITLHVEIVDTVNNMILWDNSSLRVNGEYAEETEVEEDGRQLAMTRLVQNVVDGIQSNW